MPSPAPPHLPQTRRGLIAPTTRLVGAAGSSLRAMASAFRRRGAAASQAAVTPPGTRAWVGGPPQLSTGVPSLDKVLRGGLPLGTLTILEEDSLGVHASTFLRCFVAQGVAQGQRCLACVPDSVTPAEKFQETLPALGDLKATAAASSASQTPGDGLAIAWQYRKYLPSGDDAGAGLLAMPKSRTQGGLATATPAQSDRYYASLDLARSMPPALVQRHVSLFIPGLASDCGAEASHKAATFVDATPAGSAARIAACGLGAPGWAMPSQSDTLRWLLTLKQQVRGTNVAAMVSLPSGVLDQAAAAQARHIADCTLSLMAFADPTFAASSPARITPDEFKDYTGLVYLRRLPSPMTLTPPTAASTVVFLFKRDRRKITLSKLHLPPEDAGASSLVSSAAGDATAETKARRAHAARDRRGEVLSATVLEEDEGEEDEEDEEGGGELMPSTSTETAGGAVGTPGTLCAPGKARDAALEF